MSQQERANTGLHAHVLQRIEELSVDKTALVLDIGCGSGALLTKLCALGYSNLCGLDIAPPQTSSPSLRFMQTDLDDCATSLETHSVRLEISVEVFEHVENLGALLRELSRLLSPDGVLLMTTPNMHSLEARLRHLLLGQLKQFDHIGDPTHITPIFLFPFARLLHRHGFEIAEHWGFPTDGSSPTSRPGLRALAGVLRAAGARSVVHGDQLCLLIRRSATSQAAGAAGKREALTRHYHAHP